MTKRTIALLTLICFSALAQSKDFWQTKDYREWNEKECKKMLENSPWSQDYTISDIYIEPLQTESSDRSRERNPLIKYQAQIRSALPVRQALVRMGMINNKYDQMSAEQKQQFDQRVEKLLNANFADTIAVQVIYSSNVALFDREMANFWQVQTLEKLKNTIFLIGGSGQKIPPQRFNVTPGAGREFQLYFPRTIEGRPVAGPQDKSIKLEFNHPKVGVKNDTRILIEFKIDKMMMPGGLVL